MPRYSGHDFGVLRSSFPGNIPQDVSDHSALSGKESAMEIMLRTSPVTIGYKIESPITIVIDELSQITETLLLSSAVTNIILKPSVIAREEDQ
jgi:hypothetical protein